MNDDELIQRLQRALHEQAEDLRPAPGTVPTPEAVEAIRGGAGATGGDNLYRLDPDERRTAEYTLLPPTGLVPIFGRGGRRWPPVVGIGAVVAVAAAVVAAVLLSGGHHPITVGPAATGATSTTVAPRPTTGVTGPTTTSPTTAPRPATTVAPAATVTVPAGFEPSSVTFVSPDNGWALGHDPFATGGSCAAMARTTDGGYHWSATGAPPVPGLCGSGPSPVLSLRFADPSDGWVYTTAPSDGSSQLWSTHDGGATWTEIALPVPGGTIGALEASGGWVHMVVYGACATGTTGCQGQTVERILNSPVGSDDWTKSAQQPSIGAGPVLSPQLTLWGSTGWLVNTNRTVVSGAELTGGTQWSAWTPPCSSAHGAGLVAAASATDLVAVCAEGMWGTPDPGTAAGRNWLWVSTDAGRSFNPAGPLAGDQPQSITVAPGHAQTIVVADSQQGLLASFNGGANWTTVEPGSAAGSAATPGNVFTYVGFTTSTQGVAISTQPTPTLFMTRDGGATWAPVSF